VVRICEMNTTDRIAGMQREQEKVRMHKKHILSKFRKNDLRFDSQIPVFLGRDQGQL
jgi:hypothetical protein